MRHNGFVPIAAAGIANGVEIKDEGRGPSATPLVFIQVAHP